MHCLVVKRAHKEVIIDAIYLLRLGHLRREERGIRMPATAEQLVSPKKGEIPGNGQSGCCLVVPPTTSRTIIRRKLVSEN
jgi:hypothetical protein